MKDIRAITIDLDDTLWEIHPVIRRAEERLYAWLADQYPRVTATFSPQSLFDMRQQVGREHPDMSHDYTYLRRSVLARIAAAAGYDDGLVDAAMEVFDTERNDVELFPEVRPALEHLREDYVLIAVTNGNASLDRIGIGSLFHDIVSARAAGAAKPARQIFDLAVRVGGAAAHQTLHVGDQPEIDVIGARDAGLKTVWVNRNGQSWPDTLPPPDGMVDHIGQLGAILDSARR